MAKKLRTATQADEQNIRLAVAHLRQARDHLERASCERAIKKVRAALASAEGALRHATGVRDRTDA